MPKPRRWRSVAKRSLGPLGGALPPSSGRKPPSKRHTAGRSYRAAGTPLTPAAQEVFAALDAMQWRSGEALHPDSGLRGAALRELHAAGLVERRPLSLTQRFPKYEWRLSERGRKERQG